MERLIHWYLSKCDGDWEHSYGFEITCLDNPGIHLEIDLAETELVCEEFEQAWGAESKDSWMFAKIDADKFIGSCAPKMFERLVDVFLQKVGAN